jgi:hypothetical protein
MIFHKQECIQDLASDCGRVSACLRKMGRQMSLMLFHRGFYTNLVRSAFAGNGVTAAGSLFAQFSHKAALFLPFGNHGLGALGDVVFNSCWVFALICLATTLRQVDLPKRRRLHIR